MPELPDVETVARRLRRRLIGRTIRSVRVITPSTVRSPSVPAFRRRLRGRRVEHVGRRGKYLLIGLRGDLVLVVHLRMTGDLDVADAGSVRPRHTRVAFALDGEELRFVDQRRFGHMDLLPRSDLGLPGLARLGVEPLGREFTAERLRGLLRGRRGRLKPLLLRQEVIAGIGNIYADEILWQARLHPERRVESLHPAEVLALFRAIRGVLARATAGRSRYGRPVGRLLAAREAGARCPRCGGPIAVGRTGGRGTYYCPRCQPRPGRRRR